MHFLAKVAVLSLLACAFVVNAWSEENHSGSGSIGRQGYQHSSARLLNTDEGLAIIGAALEFRHHNHSRPDCSHFVNSIYQKAGFPYDYANSIELYTGTDAFRRVLRPQPGDLIVWQGHVGIVIQPAQHTFFSALRSGLGVEDYQSPYWRKRGHPRFFRYVQVAPPAVLAADTRLLNIRTSGSTETSQVNGEDAAGEVGGDNLGPEPTNIASTLPNLNVSPVASGGQAAPLVYSEKPRPEDVRVVLLRKFNEEEQSLRGQDMLRSDHPVTVFEALDVKKVHLKGNTGWAEVRIRRVSSVAQGQAKVKAYSENRRFSLTRRDPATWEVLLPAETIYVPREAAVRLFAHQLASMTDRPEANSGATEKVELARLLNALLQPAAR
jgi:NlpC/P60 family